MSTRLQLAQGAQSRCRCVARAAPTSQVPWQKKAAAAAVASVLSLGAVTDAAVANEFSVRTLPSLLLYVRALYPIGTFQAVLSPEYNCMCFPMRDLAFYLVKESEPGGGPKCSHQHCAHFTPLLQQLGKREC